MAKYLGIVNNKATEIRGTAVSAGAGDARKLIESNDQGVIDPTWLPPGIGADTFSIVTSEGLSAGNWVNVYKNGAASNVRRSDDSVGKETNGYVLAASASGATANVYMLKGTNNQVTGMVPGDIVYTSSTPGVASSTPPVAANGKILQPIGRAITATSVAFSYTEPIVLIA